MENINNQLQQAVLVAAQALEVTEDDIKDIAFVGGMTNQNYRFCLNGEDYVVRVPGVCTESMFNRENEKKNMDAVAHLQINAQIVYFNAVTGVKVTKYIDGAQKLTQQTACLDENLKLVAQILNKLHTSGVRFANSFCFEKELATYERLTTEQHSPFFEGYETIKQKVFTLTKFMHEKLDFRSLPCHIDLVPENLINDKNGKLYLIDWEYSGMNDPMWDFASFSIECNLSEEDITKLLRFYFQVDFDEKEIKKLKICIIQQDFLWSVWTLAKMAAGDDFGDYGINRFERAVKNIKEFEECYEF